MGQFLKRRVGPLPMWIWGILFVVLIAVYLIHRKNQAAAAAATQQQASATSSNLGTVPVSNLTTAAQPMPIQLGDTFVNTSVPQSINVSPSTTVNNQPPSYSMQMAPPPAPSPAYGLVNTAQGLMEWLGVNKAGSPVYNVGGGAPVYFGNASALAQGAQYEQPGYDIYTPVGYAQQVAKTAIPLNQPYVAGRT
jgi:hypothetical protein